MAPVETEAKIPCPTHQNLQAELDTLHTILDRGEKEDTWEKLEKALIRFAAVTRGGGYKHVTPYVEGVGRKGVGLQVAACMLSDRGRLSGVATELLQTLAPRLAASFQPLVSLYLEPLVKLLGRPNKVILKRADRCLTAIISHCQLPSILVELKRGLNDEAATCRRGCAGGFERASREWSKDLIGDKGVTVLEEALRKMATDKDPEVRHISKRVWARYSEVWPERVDDFSAPLTPTIRRYLDIPNPAGGPSKPKFATRPVAPPVNRSVSAASSASSNAATAPPEKPQHDRVQALASRPVRPPTIQAPEPSAGPLENKSPPRREAESVVLKKTSSVEIEPPCPPLSRSFSSGSGRRFDVPIALGRHGRSVSHNVLPTTNVTSSESASLSSFEQVRWNLLKPTRPFLSSSFSSISLPADSTEIALPQPQRRFTPLTRVVRPAPLPSSAEEEGVEETPVDYLVHMPSGASVFGNPQRLGPGGHNDRRAAVGIGKRLGPVRQAQRLAVTVPTGVAEGVVEPMKTRVPEHRALTQSNINRSKEVKGDHQPVESTSDCAPATEIISSPAGPTTPVPIDSPLMPVLQRPPPVTTGSCQSSKTAADEPAEELLKVEEEAGELTELASGVDRLLDAAEAMMFDDTIPRTIQRKKTEEELAVAVAIPLPEAQATGTTFDVPFIQPQISGSSETEAEEAGETRAAALEVSEPLSSVRHESYVALGSESAMLVSAQNEVTGKPAQAMTLPPPEIVLPFVDKQTLPLAAKPHTVSGQTERKPFKPTARSATGTVASTKQPSNAAVTGKTSQFLTVSTKLATTAGASNPKPLPVTSAAPWKTSTKPPLPISSGLTKPTVSTATKVTAKSGQPKPTAKTSVQPAESVRAPVTLPPVRKEKVRLKPPLPSFVPTRGKAKVGTTGVSSSTASTGGKKVIVAKVRPESIPLPLSPAEKAKLPPAQIPLPRSPVLHSLRSSAAGKLSPLGFITGSSPATVSHSKPLSPVLTIWDSPVEQKSAGIGPPHYSEHPSPFFNDFFVPADHFESTSTGCASIVPPMSCDSEDGDGLTGIIFKLSDVQNSQPLRPKVRIGDMVNGFDLMEFSSPSRPAQAPRSDVSTPSKTAETLLAKLVGTTTPKSAAGVRRTPLSVRDANVGRGSEGVTNE